MQTVRFNMPALSTTLVLTPGPPYRLSRPLLTTAVARPNAPAATRESTHALSRFGVVELIGIFSL